MLVDFENNTKNNLFQEIIFKFFKIQYHRLAVYYSLVLKIVN